MYMKDESKGYIYGIVGSAGAGVPVAGVVRK